METQWTPEMSSAVTGLLKSILSNGMDCPMEVLEAAISLSKLWTDHPFNASEFYLDGENA
jgi:hypothetical protein